MINNSGRFGKRANDGLGILSQADKFNQSVYPIPTVDSFAVTDGSYVPLNDTAADPAGGQTIVVYGSGFRAGATVMVGTTVISVVTVLGNDRITFTSPALASGSYTIYVTNSNGGTGILVPGLVYSGVPTWSNSAGTLGSFYETTSLNTTLIATGDTPMTYSVVSGSLPTGATLYANGVIVGTSPVESNSTTYSFTVQATDAQYQDTLRSFSITVNTDVVTWVNPASDTSYNLQQNTLMSNVTLSATSAAGYAVSYSANALPSGVSLSNGVVYGTPTVVASNVSLLTATAATTNRSATRTITWVVSLAGDQYWKYAALLLSANSSIQTSSFINDASLNNSQLVVAGDARANNINPYQHGYYSTFFNNSTSDYLSIAATSAFNIPTNTTPFTFEGWFNLTSSSVQQYVFSEAFTGSGAVNLYVGFNNGGTSPDAAGLYPVIGYYTGSAWVNAAVASSAIVINRWYHIAWVFTGSNTYIFVNGVNVTAAGAATTWGGTLNSNGDGWYLGRRWDTSGGSGSYYAGYMSNVRFVKGVALYTAAFTPSSTPLLPTVNTQLLTCQQNQFRDESLNNLTLTVSGTPRLLAAHPFTAAYQANTQYYGVYFDGTGDYLTVPSNAAFAFGTGDFTIEGWWYFTGTIGTYQRPWWFGDDNDNLEISTSVLRVGGASQGTLITGGTTIIAYQWYHIALTRASGVYKLWLNGTQQGSSATNSYNSSARTFTVNATSGGASPVTGYTSNLRITKGQALYTAAFSPTTSPLTTTSQSAAAGNVSLLTCQSSSIIDNSNNAFAITVTGDAKPLPISPFRPGYYSVYLNGANSISVPNTSQSTLNVTTGATFTIEAWVNLNSLAATRAIVADNVAGSATAYWGFEITTGGYLKFWWYSGGNIACTATTTAMVIGTWYHVAISVNAGAIGLYVNGIQQALSGTTTLGTPGGNVGTITVGQYGSPAVNMLGYISNVRITKSQALYTTTFTPSTAPLTTTSQGATASNVSLLVCQSLYFIDTSNSVLTVTQNSSPVIAGVSPFTPATNYTSTAVTTWGSGYFDGTGDYLTVAASPAFYLSTGNWTIETWVYKQTTGKQIIVAQCQNTGAPYAGWSIYVGTTEKFTFEGTNGGTLGSPTVTVPLYSWTHLAAVKSGSNIFLYQNGALVNSGAAPSVTDYSVQLAIGNYSTYVSGADWNGYISNLRIIKGTALYTAAFVPSLTSPLTAVTNTRLLTLQSRGAHNNSTFNDNSGFGNVVTRTANVTAGTFSPYGNNWSNYFDGTGDYLSAGTDLAGQLNGMTGDYTVEAWVYLNAVPSGATYNTCFSLLNVSTGTSSIYHFWGITNAGYISIDRDGSAYRTNSATIPTVGTWNHVAFVNQGTTITVYLNGTSVGTLSCGGTWYSSCTVAYIGCSITTGGFFNGYISNLRVNKSAVYTTGFTPSSSPILSTTNTILLTCQSSRFIDASPTNTALTRNGDASVQRFSPFSTVTLPTYYSNYFDGTGDYLSLATNTAFDFSTGSFTVEAWVYPTSLATDWFIISATGSGGLFVGYATGFGFGWGRTAVAWDYRPGTLTTNTWQHVAVTRNGTSMYVFINGTQAGTTQTLSTAYNLGTTSTTVGSQGANYYLNGYISNLRVVKGQALYTANFTPATSTLSTTSQGAAAANVSLLTCQSSTLIDNSTNYFTITANGDVKPLAVTPFTATASDAVEYSTTTFGGSMYFDGTGDVLTAPGSTAFTFGAGDFTVEYWVYHTAVAATYNQHVGAATTSAGFAFGTSGTALKMYMTTSTTGYTSTGTSFTLYRWHHVAYTRIGGTVKFYLDGVLNYAPGSIATTITETGYGIGGAPSGTLYPMTGYLADIRVFKGIGIYTANFYPGVSPLTPVYAIGTTNYTSSLMLTGTNGGVIDATRAVDLETVGDAKIVQFSPYSGSYYSNYFDGSSFIYSPNINFSTNNFTIEGWFYATTVANLTNFWGMNNAAGTNPKILMYINASGSLTVDMGNAGTTQFPVSASVATYLPANAWNHIALVRTGIGTNQTVLYINGISVSTGQIGTNLNTITNNFNIGYIGEAYGQKFSGYISNFRIVNGTAVYTGNFTPGTTPLTTLTNTALLTCQSKNFIDNSANAFAITVSGTPKVQTQNPFQVNTGNSYYFDGTGDSFLIPSTPNTTLGSGDFTIECWFYTNTVASNQMIFDARPTAEGAYPTIYITSSATVVYYTSSATRITSGTVVAGTWYYLAVVRSSGSTKMYLNGTQAGSTYTDSATYLQSAVRVGSDYTPSTVLNGYISDFRLTKGYARYTTTFTPPTTPLNTN